MRRETYGLVRAACCALLWLVAACAPAPNAVEPSTAEATTVAQAVSATLTARPTTARTPTPVPATLTALPSPTALPRTAAPTDSPTPTTPSHTPTPTQASAPTRTPTEPTPSPLPGPVVWEQDITLQTYGWQDALVPTEPGDPIYPYPRLDFDAVTSPEPRAYRAVFIQNQYVRLIVVPELGGRILRWIDRTTGRQLFYANPVIKPTRWGYRGWWLATGGMEWAFPTEEHGLNEYRPWQYELLGNGRVNGVRVWDVEDHTGMIIEVMILLDSEHSSFTVVPRITNPTAEAQRYQFWVNAMLTLSEGNRPSSELRFVLPDDAVTVHATGDGSLPDPGAQMSWPVYAGRDFSRYSEWRRYLGVFADPAKAGFFGAYDPATDQGVVRVFPHTVARGVKIFCLGDLPSSLWTDDSSRYFELWGGLTPTFWDARTLEPGASVSWVERWYPVSGIGGYDWANEEAAIRLTSSDNKAEVAMATSRAVNGTVVLRRGGAEVQRWHAFITPGQPFHATGGAASGGEWEVQLLEGGEVIAWMRP